MKVHHRRGALIVSRIFRPEPAAAAFRLGAVADECVQRQMPVQVLTTKVSGAPGSSENALKVSRFPVLRDRKGYVRGYLPYMSFDIPLLFRMLLARRPQVVLVEPPPTTGAVARIACWLRGVPYVWYAADIWSDATAGAGAIGPVVAVVRFLEKFALRGARSVIAVSDGVAQRAQELGGKDVRVVPNGIDTDVYNPEVKPPTPTQLVKLGITRPYLLYTGTASEWQEAEEFAKAFQTDESLATVFQLVYVGGGSRWGELKRIRDASDDPHSMVLLDTLPPDTVAALLRGAQAALVSLAPGKDYDFAYPTKVLAALAAGTPVLYAGPGAAGADVEREHFGVWCPLEQKTLPSALNEIVTFRWDDTQAAVAHRWVCENRSLTSTGRQVADILQEAAGAHPPNVLVILTSEFPANRGDGAFLNVEIGALAERFDRVVILSRKMPVDTIQALPKNVTYAGTFALPRRTLLRKVASPRAWRSALSAFAAEAKSGRVRKRPLYAASAILAGIKFAAAIENEVREGEYATVYSFWGVGGAQALPFLPGSYRKTVRLHGGDLYEDPTNPLPLRAPIFASADNILTVSEHGKTHLQNTFPHLAGDRRVQVARLGTNSVEYVTTPPVSGPLRVVSCSTVTANKRVSAILEAVQHLSADRPVEWTHLGGGEQLDDLRAKVALVRSKHPNLEVSLTGPVTNQEVLKFHQQHPAHVFVNASDSEGVPVSIMEALSAGIPAVATAAGGTPELVNPALGSGLTTPLRPPTDELAAAILQVAEQRSSFTPRKAWEQLADGHAAANEVASLLDPRSLGLKSRGPTRKGTV